MKLKYLILGVLLPVFLGTGCQSLEDTYADYAGDGSIRYLGQCTEVEAVPGWQRIIVSWTNNIDPVISNIKITWSINDVVKDTLLESGITECSIPNLKEDGNYEIAVHSIDENGNESVAAIVYSRPYTEEHEVIRSFTRLITKHFFVGDRLALFFSSWQSGISSATLTYTKAGGEKGTLELDSALVIQKYCLLPERVDPTQPLTLEREGRVENCEDLIVFEPVVFGNDKMYTSDFSTLMETKYGVKEITEDLVQGISHLEVDYSMNSLEDCLNLPSLAKISLGKNRFMEPNEDEEANIWSEFYDLDRTRFVLDVLNEVKGVTVDRYCKHFLPDSILPLPYVTDMGAPELPNFDYLVNDGWELSCTPEDADTTLYDSHLEHLFDGDLMQYWQPETMTSTRSYEIVVDFKEAKTLTGAVVTQKVYAADDFASAALAPGIIRIQVSMDETNWENATYVLENTLGTNRGESTVIHFSEPLEAQYIKFMVDDQLAGSSTYCVSLSEIGLF